MGHQNFLRQKILAQSADFATTRRERPTVSAFMRSGERGSGEQCHETIMHLLTDDANRSARDIKNSDSPDSSCNLPDSFLSSHAITRKRNSGADALVTQHPKSPTVRMV